MARGTFRTIGIDIWRDRDFKALSLEAKSTLFFLWTYKRRIRLRLYTDLTYPIIERYVNEMETDGLAHDTIRQRIAVIRLAGNHMAKRGFPSPVAGLRLVRKDRIEKRHWKGEQLLEFLQWVKKNDPRFYSMRLLQGLCGFRLYEAGSVRERDIDFEAKTIAVPQNPYHRPKNLSSFRTVPVGDFILSELKWAIANRTGDNHEGFLTLTKRHKLFKSMANLKDESCKAMAEYNAKHRPAGVPYITAKDLRKSFIDLSENKFDCDTRTLDFYTGHSDGSTRDRHYSARDIESMRRKIADKVEVWIWEAGLN